MSIDDDLIQKYNCYCAAFAVAIYADDFQLLVYHSPKLSDGEPTAVRAGLKQCCAVGAEMCAAAQVSAAVFL